MGNEGARLDQQIARVAGSQHGVVTTAQLSALGLGRSGVARRARAGRLHRVHRGVYAVGHRALGEHGTWMAAVLACGAGARVSHRSAAMLWKLLPWRAGAVHVVVPAVGGRRRRDGLVIHRRQWLPPSAFTVRDGVPVTTVARTLSDLRGSVPNFELRQATRQAEYLGYYLGEIETDRTRSDLERAFLRLCRRHDLPTPEVNVRIGRFTADFVWREQRLIVETDGFANHRGRQAFEDDRARELEFASLGFRTRRFSDTQVGAAAAAIGTSLRADLGR